MGRQPQDDALICEACRIVNATVTGSKELSRKLAALGDDAQKHLERAAVAGALVIQNRAKQLAPFKTGTLRRSIHIGGHADLAPGSSDASAAGAGDVPAPEVSKNEATVYIGTNLEYAAMQEFGGTIRPRNAKALVFEIDGETIVTQSVTIQPQPYMRPAYDEGRDEALRVFGLAMADIIKAAAQ